MAVSIVNAAIENIKAAIEAVHAADNAIRIHVNAGASASSASASLAAAKVIVSGQKLSTVVASFASIEKVLKDSDKAIAAISPIKQKELSRYANGKPMPFLADYDIVTAKLIIGNIHTMYQQFGLLTAVGSAVAVTESSPAPALTASMLAASVEGGKPVFGWATLEKRFTDFLASVGARPAAGGSLTEATSAAVTIPASCDFSHFRTITVPNILRINRSSNNAGSVNANTATAAAAASSGASYLTAEQSAMIQTQHEPLRKELETLEYNFGVCKNRLQKELQEQSINLNSTEVSTRNSARRSILLARMLMLAAGSHLVDYHFRVGRYAEAGKYASLMDGDMGNLDFVRPADQTGGNAGTNQYIPESRLGETEFQILAPFRFPAMLAKIVVYHTFHTDHFTRLVPKIVARAMAAVADGVAMSSGLARSAAGANASSAASGGTFFIKIAHEYERLYSSSKNGAVHRIGVPMPRYGLPDVETSSSTSTTDATKAAAVDDNATNESAAAPDGGLLAIPLSSFTFDGSQLLSDLNMQSAFNPLCAPLFSIADYTLLVAAEFYAPLSDVAVVRRNRFLPDTPYVSHAVVEERWRLHRASLAALRRLRVDELTGAQYDHVKTLMFGQCAQQCEQLAREEVANGTMATASSPTATNDTASFPQEQSAAAAVSAAASVTYSSNSPVLTEIARTASVLAMACMSRDEMKSGFLAVPEVQVLLSVEAESVADDFEKKERKASADVSSDNASSSFYLTSPTSGKKISTTARAIVQGVYDTRYSDAMLGLTMAHGSILGDFFPSHPMLAPLVNFNKRDIRESIVRRLLQPYARISMAAMVQQLSLYHGVADPIAQLQEELRGMILHNKLGPSVRIDWKAKEAVRLQTTYGNANANNAAKGGAAAAAEGSAAPRLDQAILGVAQQLKSEAGVSFTRAAERLLRTSSIRATRLDDNWDNVIPKELL